MKVDGTGWGLCPVVAFGISSVVRPELDRYQDAYYGNGLWGLEVDGTGSGSCPVAGFVISSVEPQCSATRVSKLVTKMVLRKIGCEDGRWLELVGTSSVDCISSFGICMYCYGENWNLLWIRMQSYRGIYNLYPLIGFVWNLIILTSFWKLNLQIRHLTLLQLLKLLAWHCKARILKLLC